MLVCEVSWRHRLRTSRKFRPLNTGPPLIRLAGTFRCLLIAHAQLVEHYKEKRVQDERKNEKTNKFAYSGSRICFQVQPAKAKRLRIHVAKSAPQPPNDSRLLTQ